MFSALPGLNDFFLSSGEISKPKSNIYHPCIPTLGKIMPPVRENLRPGCANQEKSGNQSPLKLIFLNEEWTLWVKTQSTKQLRGN